MTESAVSAETLFQYGTIILVALMSGWTLLLWRNSSFTQQLLFRVIPFLLVIVLFGLAFSSERLN